MSHQCDKCDYKTNNSSMLKRHIAQRHIDEKPLSCKECGYKCVTSSDMKRHILYKHSDDKPIKCEVENCDFSCKRKDQLKGHTINEHTDEDDKVYYECDKCSYKNPIENNLKYHIKTVHSGSIYKCDKCDFITHTKSILNTHIKNKHNDNKPFKCDLCDYSCKYKNVLEIHINRIHTDDKPIKCREEGCDYSCALNRDLKLHMMSHTGELPVACDLCDFKCKTVSNLNAHKVNKHTAEKILSCKFCNQKFKHKRDMERHITSKHTNYRDFKCNQCDYSTTRVTELYYHKLRCHTINKPKICEKCEKSFATGHDLQRHITSTHSVDKPYECDLCDSSFKTKSGLKNHKYNVHESKRPFACTECKYKCKYRFTLKDHYMNCHNSIRSFICDVGNCVSSFKTKNSLLGHKRNIHRKEFQQIHKVEEHKIDILLKKHNLEFIREHIIDFNCVEDIDGSRAVIDFVLLIENNIIFIEIDENQHKYGNYGIACDMKRMSKIIESLTIGGLTMPVLFIRYNPNTYFVDDIKCRVKQEDRQKTLIEYIKNYKSDPDKLLQVQYMFYDIKDEKLVIHNSDEYNELFKNCCLEPIY